MIAAGDFSHNYISYDSGNSWSTIPGLTDYVYSLNLSKSRIIAGLFDKIAISEDRGSTWTAYEFGNYFAEEIIISDDTLFVGTIENGIFASPILQKQDVEFPLTDKTYGDEPFKLNATSSADLPIVFVVDTDTVISIAGDTASIVGSGTVTITAIQNGNLFYAPDTVSATLTVAPLITAVPEASEFGKERYSIYPNPSKGRVIIDHTGTIDVSGIQIFDVVGRQSTAIVKIHDDHLISVFFERDGLYLLKINVGGKVQTRRLIIEK
jgi:hypothetical protein